MAKKYKLLLKMQLYSLFGLNRLLHSHDKKEKNPQWFLHISAFLEITPTMLGGSSAPPFFAYQTHDTEPRAVIR